MKKTVLLLFTILISSLGFAQDGFNYKALVTDNGNPVANSLINVKVTIKRDNGTVDWQEEHTSVQTDANGIFSISIGEGNRLAGTATSFDDIYWLDGMTISVDVNTGSGYTTLVTDENLNYVPYAKKSKSLETEKNVYMDKDAYIKFNDFNNYLTGPHFYMGVNSSGNSNSLDIGTYDIMIPTHYFPAFSINDTNSNVTLHGKLLSEDIGNADLKPLTYGSVNSSGTLNCDLGNVTITHSGTGIYDISVTGVNDFSDNNTVIIATLRLNGFNVGGQIRAYSNTGTKIRVRTYDKDGNLENKDFQFVIYKK